MPVNLNPHARTPGPITERDELATPQPNGKSIAQTERSRFVSNHQWRLLTRKEIKRGDVKNYES